MKNKRIFLLFILFFLLGIPTLGFISLLVNRSPVGVRGELKSRSTAAYPSQPNDMIQTDAVMGAPAVEMMKQEVGRTSTILPYPVPGGDGFVAGEDRTIIKTATLGIIADNPRQTAEKVSQLTKVANGLVTTLNVFESPTYKDNIQATMTLRIPADKLEDTLGKIRELANKVTDESISSDDRTKQKVDLEARLKNLRASEDQLLLIMRQAKNVTETLEVQRQLTEIRGQIEVMAAQLQNLEGDAAMSTINLTITSQESELPTINPNQTSIFEEIKVAIKDSIRFYRALFISGLKLIIFLLPLLIIAAIGWLVWKRKARKS
jgi:hypothetical protein